MSRFLMVHCVYIHSVSIDSSGNAIMVYFYKV